LVYNGQERVMRRLVVLGSVLAVMLAALYLLTRDPAAPLPQTGGESAESSAHATTARQAPSELPSHSGVEQHAQAPSAPAGEPAPVQWKDADLSKRVYVQRDDDSVPWPKNAPPPLFKKETLEAIRTAVTPGVDDCMAKTSARYAEALKENPELKGEITVAYTARAASGAVSISAADVSVQGFPDDDLATCVKDVYLKAHVNAPGQRDGTGKVAGGFSWRK
jgi:hypothetical protein